MTRSPTSPVTLNSFLPARRSGVGLRGLRARSRTIVSFALVCAGWLVASPALAQEPQAPFGSRIPRATETSPLEESAEGRVRNSFVNCVYTARRKLVENFVTLSDPKSVDFRKLGFTPELFSKKFDMERCLSRATVHSTDGLLLKMNHKSFRDMMVEKSYVMGNPAAPAWLNAMPPQSQRRFFAQNEQYVQARTLAEFADCVVRANPTASDALLRTAFATGSERVAAGKLAPVLGGCLYEGQTIDFEVQNIRAIVADGLWAAWRSVVSPSPTVSKGQN